MTVHELHKINLPCDGKRSLGLAGKTDLKAGVRLHFQSSLFFPLLTEAQEVFTLPTYFTPYPITNPTAVASLLPFLCKAISSGEPIISPQHTPALSLISETFCRAQHAPYRVTDAKSMVSYMNLYCTHG